MMALIMARLMCEALSLIVAVTVCPAIWWRDGASKAVAALVVAIVVGKLCAPSREDREAFDKFTRKAAR